MLTKVTRVPVTKEDLTIGFQKENQIRNAGQADYTQINAANIKGAAYINTFTELKAIDTDTVDADSLFIVRETDDIYIYRYDRNSTASEDLVYNTILVPNDNKGRFIKINGINYLSSNLPYPTKLTLNQPFKVEDDYGCVVPERYVIGESGELTIEGSGVFMVVDGTTL